MAEEQAAAPEVKAAPEVENETEELKQKLSDAEENAQKLKVMQERYHKDEVFKERFDKIWANQSLEREVAKVESSIDPQDPESMLKAELRKAEMITQKLNERLDRVEGTIIQDKTNSQLAQFSQEYASDFDRLALEAGYEPGTTGYEILFDKTEKEGNIISRQTGVAPLQKYNSNLVKKSFGIALKKMEEAGFHEAWKQRSQAMKQAEEEKRRKQAEGPGPEKFFTPERKKSSKGLIQAMEESFRAKFGSDLKL